MAVFPRGSGVDQSAIKTFIRAKASALGFASVGFARAETAHSVKRHLSAFVDGGWHGDMAWLAETQDRRSDPRRLWPAARTAILFTFSYTPDDDPLAGLADGKTGNISVYARGKDYHDILKPKLKQIARELCQHSGGEVKVFVDTAPLMEKPLGEQAGVGWQGKHTNLVSREAGSWFFLGAILTTLDIAPDEPEGDHCGACRKCLDICPTGAFPAPYQLDARRCISYLTIEHKGHIPRELRRPIGNRIYGCDDCLAVCPWNKFAAAAGDHRLVAGREFEAPRLSDLLRLDDAAFRARFAGSPIKRTGRDRMIRNVLIAAGNSGDTTLIPAISALLDEGSALVRAMAVWALSQLGAASELERCARERIDLEDDVVVVAEWRHAGIRGFDEALPETEGEPH